MTPKEKILAWIKTLDGETAAWIEDMAAAASLYAKHDRDHASQRDWDDVLDAAFDVMKMASPNPHNQPAIGDVVELDDGRQAKVRESETEGRCPKCIFYAGKSQCDAGMEYGHCDAANRDDKTSIIFAPVEPDYIECEVGLNAQGDTYLCCGKGIRAYLYDIICHKDFHGFRSPEGEVFTDRSIPNDISEKWLVLLRKDGE